MKEKYYKNIISFILYQCRLKWNIVKFHLLGNNKSIIYIGLSQEISAGDLKNIPTRIFVSSNAASV